MIANKPLVTGIVLLAAGCAAPIDDQTQVASASGALTLEECTAQRDACYAENPFFGLFTCPAQYRQCRLTADDGLPAQVVAAVADAGVCVDEGQACRADAFWPSETTQCVRDEAWCLASIVGIEPPQIVEGTRACVDGLVECIRASESAGDLDGCGETYLECAIDVVADVLPPELEATFEDLSNCRFLRNQCAAAAETPGELTLCAEEHLMCVGDTLNVQFPDPPVAEALQCSEDATACGLAAESPADVEICREDLRACVVEAAAPVLDCEAQWVLCTNSNPFAFISCTAQFALCDD